MQPKPEGYVDDFTAKYGHCNGIQVNGILAAAHPRKLGEGVVPFPIRERGRMHAG